MVVGVPTVLGCQFAKMKNATQVIATAPVNGIREANFPYLGKAFYRVDSLWLWVALAVDMDIDAEAVVEQPSKIEKLVEVFICRNKNCMLHFLLGIHFRFHSPHRWAR